MTKLLSYIVMTIAVSFLVRAHLFANSSKKVNRISAAEAAEHKIPVEFNAQGIGKEEIEIIFKDSIVYLPIVETFSFVGIKTTLDSFNLQVRGFYRSADNEYVMDFNNGVARLGKREMTMTEQDFVLTESEFYIRMEFLNEMFNLDFSYSPRALRVELRKTKELPAFLAAERHRRVKPFGKRLEMPEPSVYYGRDVGLVGAGRIDWTTIFLYNRKSHLRARYTFNAGLQVMGGDVTAQLIGTAQPSLRTRAYNNNLRGHIRYPVFNSSLVRQIIVGDYISSGFLPKQVTGIEITNRPFVQRLFFTREVFRGQFEPNTDIELSAQGLGQKILQTDEQGSYQFDYPVLYGQGTMEVKAYDPYGQVKVMRYRMNVSHSLIPLGEFEYSVSTGKLQEGNLTLAQAVTTSSNYFLWGVSSNLTLGGRMEYYDFHDIRRKFYGSINATALPFRGFAFDALVAPGAFSKLSLDWVFPTNARATLDGTSYSRNPFFNYTQQVNNLELRLNVPIEISSEFRTQPEFFVNQTVYETYREREMQLGLSFATSIFYPRFSSDIRWRTDSITVKSTYLSNASLGVTLLDGAFLQSNLQYNHLNRRVESFQLELSKRYPNNILIGVSYLREPPLDFYNIGLRVEYYSPFARSQGTVTRDGSNEFTYSLYGSGSVSFDPKTTSIYYDNRASYVGYAGINVRPFLDMNGNGKFDVGEPRIERTRVYVMNATRSVLGNPPLNTLSGDKLVLNRIPVYEEYDVMLDPTSLENPIWTPEYGSMRMLSEPNYVRRIDFPVVSGGTVRGNIKIVDGVTKPAEGIKVILTLIQNGTKRKLVRTTSSFSTGEFEFTQVPPGAFRIELEASQTQTLGYIAEPSNRQIEIIAKPEGDIVSNVDFVLRAK